MTVGGWDIQLGDNPLPPINPMVVNSMMIPGALDIRWDDPALLVRNSKYTIVGVNIYRSDVSDRGPYFGPINEFPVGGGFYRDRTDIQLIENELVPWNSPSWRFKGNAPNNRKYVFCTQNPSVKNEAPGPYGKPTFANAPTDVVLRIDGQVVPVSQVFGRDGSVELINRPYFDHATEKLVSPILPDENSVVEVSYFKLNNLVRSGLDAKSFYRVVTVALDTTSPTGFRETPLDFTQPINKFNVEQLDWIWREAIRRNHWILEQGGERVKLFIRRTAGIPCRCRIDPRELELRQQPLNSCRKCFGTGFLGGYEGPFDIIIVQDGAENRIAQRMRGRKKEKTQDVWMTLTPMVTQRDFITKQTGERFSIGPVTRQTARGVVLQQHYNIGYLDETDIRYLIPIDGTADLIRPPTTRYSQTPAPLQPGDGDTAYQGQHHIPVEPPFPVGNEARWPEVTEKDNINDTREVRSRTGVGENINYVWPFVLYFVMEMAELGARGLA
jgi:hypothetical protein